MPDFLRGSEIKSASGGIVLEPCDRIRQLRHHLGKCLCATPPDPETIQDIRIGKMIPGTPDLLP